MTVESLITELEAYDPNLPIVLQKDNNYRGLSFADIIFKDDVSINGHNAASAILISGYDD